MKNKIYKQIIYLLLLTCFVQQLYGQTPVTYTSNPSNAQINGVFSEAPNIIITGGTLNAGVRNKQIAIFKGGTAAGLEIDEGLFLGTGNVDGLLKKNSSFNGNGNISHLDLFKIL